MEKIPHAIIHPFKSLNLLSREEIERLTSTRPDLFELFRNCALAILNTDSNEDDATRIYASFADFDIRLAPRPRGLRLEVFNAPAQSFVDGRMIRGIQEHLFSALRDIVYTDIKINTSQSQSPQPGQITNNVFRILRNARVVRPDLPPRMAVCWGGHSISRQEYDYAKQIGYELGLRGVDIVTGCGIGAMKGPMKGAAVGHAKQQYREGRYIGISEPGIIASESPNAIVNELVIMPDIEKRLEAFVRLAHTIVVFPGGVGTVEEILYLLGIVMQPDNRESIPVVFAGPESAREYFHCLESFLVECLGERVRQYYQLFIGEPETVGRAVKQSIQEVHTRRRRSGQAYYFNWELQIDQSLQQPFLPTHENMAGLRLDPRLPAHELASELRRAFSGMVAGNLKPFGVQQVKAHGPYRLHGDPKLMQSMDTFLQILVREKRMKLDDGGSEYRPCYQIVKPAD
ncbi:MAG: LOG family protein [Gammaproteobacteria bacterium]|uniref:nucleotide 5'-monophosphate nucleosidase PpnN n=1 Tax=Pseudomaricurvus alcaniphilus TaxID=1166482 RepID=UPI00140C4567|nr:nucleotide 5'-monophosphate nucleosidase PpnN [Pseudomaricurvus alcaniphilus]MBR9912192.1 LOG family protein [Gammaproteobacteria bacterium]NHN38744.1 LOG family protein [Pseudomaricurvus alcaniphilus]